MPQHQIEAAASMKDETNVRKRLHEKIWPVPVPAVVLLIPLLPKSLYVNRGYTVWFHLMSFAYLLTRSAFLRKVLVLQGAAICLGWYCAIAHDGNLHTLYRNMPRMMLSYMVEEAEDEERNYAMLGGTSSKVARALSLVLDFAGHPGLTWLLWRSHRRSGGSLEELLSWPVIAVAWHCSRLYSLFHNYYNTGALSLWYFGYDVYVLSSLDVWLVAYAAEGALFLLACCCRLTWDRWEFSHPSNDKVCTEKGNYEIVLSEKESPPSLIHSQSAVSTSSLI